MASCGRWQGTRLFSILGHDEQCGKAHIAAAHYCTPYRGAASVLAQCEHRKPATAQVSGCGVKSVHRYAMTPSSGDTHAEGANHDAGAGTMTAAFPRRDASNSCLLPRSCIHLARPPGRRMNGCVPWCFQGVPPAFSHALLRWTCGTLYHRYSPMTIPSAATTKHIRASPAIDQRRVLHLFPPSLPSSMPPSPGPITKQAETQPSAHPRKEQARRMAQNFAT